MVGEQLLVSGIRYEASEWEKLPEDAQKEARVHQVKKGLLHLDKTLKKLKSERDAEKHAKQRAVPLPIIEWQEKAQEARVGKYNVCKLAGPRDHSEARKTRKTTH
jgi:hypothetical protein